MLRKKLPIAVLIAVFIAATVFFYRGDGTDQDLFQQLAEQQARQEFSSKNELMADQPRKLTSETVARKGPTRSTWTVESTSGFRATTSVVLPFNPAVGIERTSDNQSKTHSGPNNHAGFLGAAACAECHQENHRGFVSTAHHRTSAPLAPEAAHGSFGPDSVVQTDDPHLSFTVRRSDQQAVQQVTLSDWSLAFPMDVVVGTAKIGQSFLYWHGDALYQTHLSYLTRSDDWIPSPGYAETAVTYARPIRSGCLECHITYIKTVEQPNLYDRDTAIWGISCERCHGPGQQHVDYHREHPQQKQSKHIVYPRDLPRQGQLDLCGQCHSGAFTLLQQAFTFRPGDDLEKFHQHPQEQTDKVGGLHTSNQLTRLKKSLCFQQSQMTCTTCHNPHRNQRGEIAVFTQSCLGCHQVDHCGMATDLGESISTDCVSCHMPIAQNEDLTNIPGGGLQAPMRDHHIRIDQTATQRYLAQ